MNEWQTITALARTLEVSRRTLVRALERGEEIDGLRVESRPRTDEDLTLPGVNRGTTEVARVVPDAAETEEDDDWHDDDAYGSLHESLRRLVAISRGEVTGFRASGGNGGGDQEPPSIAEMSQATERAEKLRQRLEELDSLYLPQDRVANALASLGALFRERLQAIPSRIADRVAAAEGSADVRSIIGSEVDEVLMEVADAADQCLRTVLR